MRLGSEALLEAPGLAHASARLPSQTQAPNFHSLGKTNRMTALRPQPLPALLSASETK